MSGIDAHKVLAYEFILDGNFLFVLDFLRLLKELCAVETYLRVHMSEAFYDSTIEEWLGCYLDPIKDKLSHLIRSAESQLSLNL